MNKKSLARNMFVMVSIFTFIVLAATLILQLFNEIEIYNFKAETNKIFAKEQIVTQLNKKFSQIFLETKNIVYQQKEVLFSLQQDKDQTESLINQFSNISEDITDRQFLSHVNQFNDYYFNTLIPSIVKSLNTNKNVIPNQLYNKEEITKIDIFQNQIFEYRDTIINKLSTQYERLPEKERISRISFISFFIFIMILMIIFFRITFIRIGKPLRHLASIAEKVSQDIDVGELQEVHRQDEIGSLARAFQKMLKSIQEKEQELLSHNEELIAQQDELQAQQNELINALNYKNEHELILNRRSQLIHSLSNTLDRQELLQSIIDNMGKMIDASKGIIVLVNNKKTASFGLSENGLQQFLDHFHEGIYARLKSAKKIIIDERKSDSTEKGYHEESMKSYDFILPILSTQEEIEAILVFTRIGKPFIKNEIDEFKGLSMEISLSLDKLKSYEEMVDQRRTIKEIMDTIREGIQFVDAKGFNVQMNKQLCELWGIDNQEEHKSLSDLLIKSTDRINNKDKLNTFITSVINDQSIVDKTLLYEISNPERRMIKLYFEPLYRGNEKVGTVFVHQDITQQYEVDQMKSEFVSTVSHELRTPLSSILGYTEIMIYKQLKPDRQKKYLMTIYQETKRLTALINDFLDVQRMESGKQIYEKKYINVLPMIEKIFEAESVNTNIHTFHLICETNNTFVLGDRDKFYQVFNNVISNAVKYSPNGGNITITLKEIEGQLCVDVLDEGLGIPEESISKLFTKFYRVDNSDRRKIGGTGLGLSIVNEIMKVHEGDITVQSTLGKGTTISLCFPIIQIHNFEEESVVEQLQGKIIIIEDDSSLAALLQSELYDSGFSVSCFTSGEHALEEMKLKQINPDAFVVDIMLGEGMDGWEFISTIKEDKQFKNTPIFISSALEEQDRGNVLGICNYLIKPYEPGKLSKVILQTLLEKEKKGQILFPKEKIQQSES